ncbi:MAG: hypothetical protein R3B49_09380 [Phycisphaerales bacterium]
MYAPKRCGSCRLIGGSPRRAANRCRHNPYGDDYHEKLAGINTQMIYRVAPAAGRPTVTSSSSPTTTRTA